MKAFDLSQMDPPRDEDGHGYVDVLSSDRLSVGYAAWPAGATDRQRPHAEDEVYHVVVGRGIIDVGGEQRDVGPGSVVYVAAGMAHHFHSIEEDLRVLVFWAPPHARVVEGGDS